jgi:Fibronectin type III domain
MSGTRSLVGLVVVFLLVFWGLGGGVSAGVLDITWTAPTTHTDGSHLTALDAYRVYYASGTSRPCPGSAFVTVGGSSFSDAIVTHTLTGLTDNTVYSVSVTAVGTNGNESSCSTVAFAAARPSAPGATVPANAGSNAANADAVNAQAMLDTDSFAGTNRWALDAYSGNWRGFANWNQLAIQGTPGFGPGTGGGQANRRDGHVWTDNQWAEIVVGTGFIGTYDELFVGLRATDAEPAGRAYGGGFTTEGYQIRRWDPDGSYTVLVVDPAAHDGRSDDVINLQIVGSTITLAVSRGGAPLVTLSATDSRYLTGGTPMLWICCGDATTKRYGGSWRAGRVTP